MDPRWGYVSMVDRLTNGDITKDEEIYNTNYEYCLMKLLFWHDKDEYIEKLNKQEELKNYQNNR